MKLFSESMRIGVMLKVIIEFSHDFIDSVSELDKKDLRRRFYFTKVILATAEAGSVSVTKKIW